MGSNVSASREDRVRRFNVYRIIEHLLLIGLFGVLVLTGLPQKFHTFGISQSLIMAFGGIDAVRYLHHAAGILFSILAVQHILGNFVGIAALKWEPSMLVTVKDGFDAVQDVRYYLRLAEHPAQCGRYTYKEKCVYWVILTGGFQMTMTGFMLWFPVFVTHYLPGQFIPAAKVIHSNEAMLIFLLMATWHIYDSIFSPEVFPLDKSIFTGYIERKRMERQHPLELAQREFSLNKAQQASDGEGEGQDLAVLYGKVGGKAGPTA